MTFETIIIGAGLSGLSAAQTLSRFGRGNFVVLEKSGNPGGRVHTLDVDGYRLDLGFQVGLSSYPAFQSILPIKELAPCYFGSGALVEESEGTLNPLAHPVFHPNKIGSAILSKISLGDRCRLINLTISCLLKSDPACLMPTGLTTAQYLKQRGFSDRVFDLFFKPFFGGVFLDNELETDASLFRYYWKRFALGRAFLPSGGISRMSEVLVEKIGRDNLIYHSEVEGIKTNHRGVEIRVAGSPTSLQAKKLILATDPATTSDWLDWPKPEFKSTKVVYFSSTQSLYKGPWIVLPALENRLAQHFVQLTNVDPSLAPPGRELISATVLDDQGFSEEEINTKVASEIERLFPETAGKLKPLKVISVPQALPAQSPQDRSTLSGLPIPDGIYLAGDLAGNASLQNALQSGKDAALKTLNRL